VLDAELFTESFTVTTTVDVPDPVGVPVIAPAVDRLSPVGSEDPVAAAHDQVYPVPEPPVAANVVVGYAVPWYPVGNVIALMARAGEIVSPNVTVAVFEAESVTFTVKLGVPDDNGVPERTPAPDKLRLTAVRLLAPAVTVHV
jgi:hypothetical protein